MYLVVTRLDHLIEDKREEDAMRIFSQAKWRDGEQDGNLSTLDKSEWRGVERQS